MTATTTAAGGGGGAAAAPFPEAAGTGFGREYVSLDFDGRHVDLDPASGSVDPVLGKTVFGLTLDVALEEPFSLVLVLLLLVLLLLFEELLLLAAVGLSPSLLLPSLLLLVVLSEVVELVARFDIMRVSSLRL